jgi:hypothetical protein
MLYSVSKLFSQIDCTFDADIVGMLALRWKAAVVLVCTNGLNILLPSIIISIATEQIFRVMP